VETLDLYAEVAASTIDHHRQVAQLNEQSQSLQSLAVRQQELLDWARESLREISAKTTLQPERNELTRLAGLIASAVEQMDKELGCSLVGVPALEEAHTLTPFGLLSREVETLVNLWRGLSDQQMAAEMGISRFTVAKNLTSAMRKLNAGSRAEASFLVGRDVLRSEGEGHSFCDLLRMFRRRAGLTQAELAERAGLSHRTISDLERGVRSKTYVSTVSLITSALELDPEDSRRLAASVDRSRGSRGDRASDPSWQPANLRHG
jgi:DNA-binding CsgD family transcriptional regulator